MAAPSARHEGQQHEQHAKLCALNFMWLVSYGCSTMSYGCPCRDVMSQLRQPCGAPKDTFEALCNFKASSGAPHGWRCCSTLQARRHTCSSGAGCVSRWQELGQLAPDHQTVVADYMQPGFSMTHKDRALQVCIGMGWGGGTGLVLKQSLCAARFSLSCAQACISPCPKCRCCADCCMHRSQPLMQRSAAPRP